jgi:glucosylceramidase
MKTNRDFDGGAFRDEPGIYSAYALYLAKFVESYRAEGLGVFMVVPQNEPSQLTKYPSCDWTPKQYTTFIRDHLGPLFKSRNVPAAIYLGTINKGQWDLTSVLQDRGALTYISGVALQWEGVRWGERVRRDFPNLAIMQSETECGNNHWEPGYRPDRAPNDFAYASYTWRKFSEFLAAGSQSYMLWNMVLDEQGKNIDSGSPWPQNSAVVVTRRDRRVTYTPMFWVTKHFSGMVDVGAHRVASHGRHRDHVAFINPDRTIVVNLMNSATTSVALRVAVGRKHYRVTLPAQSFATLRSPGG